MAFLCSVVILQLFLDVSHHFAVISELYFGVSYCFVVILQLFLDFPHYFMVILWPFLVFLTISYLRCYVSSIIQRPAGTWHEYRIASTHNVMKLLNIYKMFSILLSFNIEVTISRPVHSHTCTHVCKSTFTISITCMECVTLGLNM